MNACLTGLRAGFTIVLGKAHRGGKAIEEKVGYLRKDWVALGVIELAAGIGAIIIVSLIVHLGFVSTVVVGWGMIFAVIGTVLTIYGFLVKDTNHAKNLQQRHCLYCGRRVALGAMICSRCGESRSDGKRPLC